MILLRLEKTAHLIMFFQHQQVVTIVDQSLKIETLHFKLS